MTATHGTTADVRLPSFGDTARLAFTVVLRLLSTRGRLIGLGALALATVAIGLAVGLSVDEADRSEAAVDLLVVFALTTPVPVISLVLGSAALGDLWDDKTLVYLWLRPLSRFPIVLGAYLATLAVTLPLVLVSTTLSAVISGAGSTVVVAAALGAGFGTVCYGGLFLLAGITLKRALLWGLGYILIWEGFIAQIGSGPGRLAIRGYAASIISDRTGFDVELAKSSQTTAIIVLLVVAAVCLPLAARRLDRMDVD